MPVADLIENALTAYERLAELGESVADEWQYVTDLVGAHSADLRAIAALDPARRVAPAGLHAVEVAIEEIGLISDAHRAIDWLSTFPQIIRLAVAA